MPFTTVGHGRIEYERIGGAERGSPTIVMLHEALGSMSMWKNFPMLLAQATRSNVVIYSRHGHGNSTRLQAPRCVNYLHDEALVVLPQFLDSLGIQNPILFGHSDGASIALIHAGGSGRNVGGVVALAPHVIVEDISVSSIAATSAAYKTTNLPERLARYHEDVDGLFQAWSNIWLDPAFRAWNIEEYLPRIACGILAIQGEEDEYGSMQQLERIARVAPNTRLLKLAACRHSPHRDRADAVLEAVSTWMTHEPGAARGHALPQHLR